MFSIRCSGSVSSQLLQNTFIGYPSRHSACLTSYIPWPIGSLTIGQNMSIFNQHFKLDSHLESHQDVSIDWSTIDLHTTPKGAHRFISRRTTFACSALTMMKLDQVWRRNNFSHSTLITIHTGMHATCSLKSINSENSVSGGGSVNNVNVYTKVYTSAHKLYRVSQKNALFWIGFH